MKLIFLEKYHTLTICSERIDCPMTVRAYRTDDIQQMTAIWNEVVEQGIAFPQEEPLDERTAEPFFSSQSRSAVAVDDSGRVVGLYILHPNNVGRCGRGMHIGEALVRDCIQAAGRLGFRILQFNAVVETNTAARRLYEKIGFHQLGVIPGGFRMKDGHYENICPYYIEL